MPSTNLDELSTLLRLSQDADRLVKWTKVLPAELTYIHTDDPDCEPGLFNLQMHFYTALILLHRPYADYKLISRSKAGNSEVHLLGYSNYLSQKICFENAVRITKALNKFRLQFGIGKMFTSMVYLTSIASSTLIFHIYSTDDHLDDARKWLQVCLDILDGLKNVFPITNRASSALDTYLHYCGLSEFLLRTSVNPSANIINSNQSTVSCKSIFPQQTGLHLGKAATHTVDTMHPTHSFPELELDPSVTDMIYESKGLWEL